MSRNSYNAEFKAQAVLEVLREEKTLDEIAAEKGINPNILCNWRREFLDNATSIFDHKTAEKEARRKEAQQDAEWEQMLQAIGQSTMERDFLQR